MESLIEWLSTVEDMARQLYQSAARTFSHDIELSRFLQHMSEEEGHHHNLLRKAFAAISGRTPAFRSDIILDDRLHRKIEEPLRAARSLLISGNLTKAELLGAIIESEFSEWNDIFVYVMCALKDEGREFQHAAAFIQRHRKQCLKFLERYPEFEERVIELKTRPRIWNNKILVVDDSEAVCRLLETVLLEQGEVYTASDGSQALRLVEKNYFDFVISDIEMPGMDGIEFLKKAMESDVDLIRRIVFFSSSNEPHYRDFLDEMGVPLMRKPGNVSEILEITRRALT